MNRNKGKAQYVREWQHSYRQERQQRCRPLSTNLVLATTVFPQRTAHSRQRLLVWLTWLPSFSYICSPNSGKAERVLVDVSDRNRDGERDKRVFKGRISVRLGEGLSKTIPAEREGAVPCATTHQLRKSTEPVRLRPNLTPRREDRRPPGFVGATLALRSLGLSYNSQ